MFARFGSLSRAAWLMVGLVTLAAVAAALLGLDVDPDAAAAAGAVVGPGAAKEMVRTSDTFRAPDRRMTTRIYGGSVNYRDGAGDLKPIDNTLEADAAGELHNAANRYDVSLPEDLSQPVSVSSGGDSVAFALQGAAGKRSSDDASATYADAVHGVDARYTAGPDSVKEDLILSDASAVRQFSFALDPSEGLSPSLNKAGGIDFDNAHGDAVMSFAPPVMTDADGAMSTDLRYTLKHGSPDHWTLDLDADSPWLEKAGRKFPVDVDPTVYFGIDSNLNTTIDSGAPTTPGNLLYLRAGKTSTGVSRALAKMTLDTSQVPKDAVIEGANLHLHESADAGGTGSGTPTIAAYGLTQAFTDSATWNTSNGTTAWTGGAFSATAEDTQTVDAACNCWYQWAIGNLVADQLLGAGSGGRDNFGILLKSTSESTSGWFGIDGVQTGTYAPWMDVSWAYPTGSMAQWTYDRQSLGDRSSLKVNVATGSAVYQATDLHIAGVGGMDLDVARSYDPRSTYGDSFGYEWMWNGGENVWGVTYNNAATVMIHGPGNVLWRFRKHYTSSGTWDGTYDAPPGVNATLADVSGGWQLMFNRTGQVWHFNFSKGDAVDWMNDRNGHQVSFTYDASNYVSSITHTQGRTYTFTRNALHQVTKITDAAYPGGARTWQYTYSDDSAFADTGKQLLRSYTDPNGKTTYYDYNTADDDLAVITDPRGNKTELTYTFDANSYPLVRTITRVTNPAAGTGPTTLYCYDTANHKTTVYDPDGTGGSAGANDCTSPTTNELAHKTVYSYDDHDQVTRATNQIGEDTSTTYSPNGDTASVIGQSQSGSGIVTAPSTFGHDTNNNPSSETDPVDGTNLEKATADFDTGTGAGGGQPDHLYLMKDSTDQSGGQRYYTYDPSGNTATVADGSPSTVNTSLTYTTGSETGTPPAGLLKTSTDNRPSPGTTNYLYYGSADGTKKGDLKEIQPPLVGAVHPGDETFDYDAESRLTRSTDAKSQVLSYGYDALDRLCVVATGAQTLTCASSPTGSWFKYAYDENGNLKTRTDSAGNSSTFTYDELNRRKTETVAGSAKSYGYDDIGNLTSLTDAWGTTGYGYYADNRLKTITAPGSSAISYAYDDTHYPRTQTITYPGTTGTLKSSFDLSGKPTAIDAKTTGTTKRKLAYSYLPNPVAAGSPPGELIDTENEYDNGSGTVAASWKYKYDKLLRLCAASTTGSLPASCASTATTGTAGWDQYVYDNASNRIARLIGTTKTSYGYDLANELCWAYTGSSTNACASPPAGATSYTHDSDGERTAPGSLSYDAFQRLSNIGGSNALSSLSPSNNELVGDGTTTLTNSRIGLDSSTVGGARTDYIRDPAGTLIGEHTSAGTATSPPTPAARPAGSGTAPPSTRPTPTTPTATPPAQDQGPTARFATPADTSQEHPPRHRCITTAPATTTPPPPGGLNAIRSCKRATFVRRMRIPTQPATLLTKSILEGSSSTGSGVLRPALRPQAPYFAVRTRPSMKSPTSTPTRPTPSNWSSEVWGPSRRVSVMAYEAQKSSRRTANDTTSAPSLCEPPQVR